jgi:hypothetical protein
MSRFTIAVSALVVLILVAVALDSSSHPNHREVIYRSDEALMSRALHVGFLVDARCKVEKTDDPVYRRDRYFSCGDRYTCMEAGHSATGRWIGCFRLDDGIVGDGEWACVRLLGGRVVEHGIFPDGSFVHEGNFLGDPCGGRATRGSGDL